MVGLTEIDLKAHVSNAFIMIGDKDYWGLGIGKQAMEYVIHKAYKWGITEINLEVFKSNTGAIKLYEKMGFLVTGGNGDELQMQLKKGGL